MEYFCEAKPQKGDLLTVEHTKCAVLERLVMGLVFLHVAWTEQKSFPAFNKTQISLGMQNLKVGRFYKTNRIVVLKRENVSTEGTKI